MSIRLIRCKIMDRTIDKLEARVERLRAELKQELKKLTDDEFLEFGIDMGYDEKELEAMDVR